MRISDWSSDVCSSDLGQTAGPLPRLEQIRVGWNRRRRSTDPVNLLYPFEVDRSCCLTICPGGAASYLNNGGRASQQPGGHHASSRERRRHPRALPCRCSGGSVRCAGRSHHRSEEHTSELQSLMRISSDVFCLKK